MGAARPFLQAGKCGLVRIAAVPRTVAAPPGGPSAPQAFERLLVVPALRSEEPGQLVVPSRLVAPPLLLQAPSEREVSVVVDGSDLEHLAELSLGLGEASNPEVRDP